MRNGKPLYDEPLVEQGLAQLAIEVNILRLFTPIAIQLGSGMTAG